MSGIHEAGGELWQALGTAQRRREAAAPGVDRCMAVSR